MFYLIFGCVLVFAGFYLIIKGILDRKKGIKTTATLVGFSNENNATYPVFRFTDNGQEITMSGAVPAKNPDKYKHSVGDSVNVYYSPKNTKYVTVEGEFAEFWYAIGSFIAGAVFILIWFFK